MNWNEFKQNVEQWASERGIYEHSTPEAQLLKALSELGELSDAIIKNDHEALKDAIGDVAVCMVNYARLAGEYITNPDSTEKTEGTTALIGALSIYIGGHIMSAEEKRFIDAYRTFETLVAICKNEGTTFIHCCARAWNEIKDRKGLMVPGGAFVKEG